MTPYSVSETCIKGRYSVTFRIDDKTSIEVHTDRESLERFYVYLGKILYGFKLPGELK